MEEKKLKVQRASNVLDSFMKNKRPATSPGKSDYSNSEKPYDTTSLVTEKNTQELERNVLKLDSPTLKRKTDQFDSLSKKIKNLQDELSEKSEKIVALEIENDVLRKGNGDGVGVSQDLPMIKDLQNMVDARDTFIKQLSDSLQKRSEELQASIMREKALAEEIQSLQQHVNTLTKQMEMKLSDAYSEGVEYKAKVDLMSNQIQEYSVLVQSLRSTLENNNKELMSKKEELDAKEKKLEKYKGEVSEDIKMLMRQVENLNHDLTKKEKDLIKSKKQVESVKSHMEEQFGAEIAVLKEKLENKYAEDVKKVESLYDGIMLEHIRKSESHLKTVGDYSDLEEQIKTMRELYEKEKNKFKDELKTVLEKSKMTEDRLTHELEKYKQEADHYRQQVENFENKVAEEVRKVQSECFKELDQYESEMKVEQNKYEEEIQKLGKRLKDIAVSEAAKEVEIETYKNELTKLQQYVHSMEEKFNWSQGEYDKHKSQFLAQINEFKNNEYKLMNELKISRAKLLDYENKVYVFNENLKGQSSSFNEKYQNVVRSFEEQIQNLMSELERTKAFSETEKSRLTSIINEKDNHIINLEAKVNHLNKFQTNKSNDSITTEEAQKELDSLYILMEQVNTLKKNLSKAEMNEKCNSEFLVKALCDLRQVKDFINELSGNKIEENCNTNDTPALESPMENNDYPDMVKELENTINDILNMSHSVNLRNMSEQKRNSGIHTSTPRRNEGSGSSDPSCMKDDPGNDLVRKCELLEAENIKLTEKLELLSAHMREMEYCFYVASKESLIFDEKCKDLDSKITELETLKFSEFMLKKENNELKQRLSQVEESERNARKELEDLTARNINLEKTLNKNLVDLHQEISNNGPNINLEAVLQDLKAKSDEVVRLRSQLSAVQNALKDNQEKMMQLKAQCDKFIAEHDFMMSEVKTKQKELEDVWRERNELSTENKMLQSKLLSAQGKNSWQLHNVPSSIKSSTSTAEADTFPVDKDSEISKVIRTNDDDLNDFHLRRLQTMHLLTESIALSSKTNVKDSSSNLSVASRIDLELQQLDEMFDEPDNLYMPTITEEDEEFSDEVRVFFEQMAQGDQNKEMKQKVDP